MSAENNSQACAEAAPAVWRLKIAGMLLLVLVCVWQTASGQALWLVPHWLAQGLALLGAAVQLGHGHLLRRAVGVHGADRLLSRGGFYPRVRHPMYLGELLLAAGLLLLAPGPGSLLVWLVHFPATVACAHAEDRDLAVRFPDEHARWSRTSGLLWPRLRRRPPNDIAITD